MLPYLVWMVDCNHMDIVDIPLRFFKRMAGLAISPPPKPLPFASLGTYFRAASFRFLPNAVTILTYVNPLGG